LRSVVLDESLEDDDYTKMAHYAISEWRARDIVVNIGVGYSTRKFQYSNDGREESVALAPFTPEKLMIGMQEKMEEASLRPLYQQITNLRYASGRL
jgi:hypothetical protein